MIAFFSARLTLGSKQLSSATVAGSGLWQACMTALRNLSQSFEPATRAATFCSSTTFQSM